MATATDRWEARIDTLMEAEKASPPKQRAAADSPRARAIKTIVAEDPELHQAYISEYTREHLKRR